MKTVLKSLGAIWFFTMGVGILPLTSDALSLLDRPKALALVMYLVVGTLISMFFAVIAIARTDSYTDLLGRVLGFKDFIRLHGEQLQLVIDRLARIFLRHIHLQHGHKHRVGQDRQLG